MLRLLTRSHKITHSYVARRWKSLAAQTVQTTTQYEPGDKIHGYTVEKVVPIHEFNLTAIKFTHDATGAQHLHFSRDDSNNVFSIALRTTPMDSTGVPHILEHTTLCGSSKFPVRDPFFKMLNRSLSTFMNAFTSSDWTMYPFSTQNSQDYENLMSVYLDAVFNPRLREEDFSQEGWRLEHEDPTDPGSPIIFKGVVFNEMKGVFSNSQHSFAQAAQNKLLPNHTYSICYGGDPEYITDLTHDQLKQFHATHYHPSNARFFTYGDFPVDRHLQLINELALKNFSKIQPNTEVPNEPRWGQPRRDGITCRPDPMAPDPKKQTTVAVSYLLGDITDCFEAFTLNILCTLLVHGEKAPFYQSLLEANIGTDYSPVIGYDGNTRDAAFSVGLQGIHEKDVDRVVNIIEQTVDNIISNGIEPERIDALLHRIELSQKHQQANFGLGLAMNIASLWNHDGDPTEMLQINKHVQRFQDELAKNPKFLQEKVAQYFKDNQHTLTLTMRPEDDYDQRLVAKEQEKLQRIVNGLSDKDKQNVYDKGKKLAELQMTVEDLSYLPTLKVSDIKKMKGEDIVIEKIGNCSVQFSDQPTNGVTYFRALTDVSDMPSDLVPYLPLFSTVITKMGAGTMDFKELSQEIELKTGGLSASTHITQDLRDIAKQNVQLGVLFSSFCLDKNVAAMFDLWSQIFTSPDFSDMNRLQTLVQMSAAELASSLADSGHMYAMSHSGSYVDAASHVGEKLDGITQVSLMKRVAEMSSLEPVLNHLNTISQHVLSNLNQKFAINSELSTQDLVEKKLSQFIGDLPQRNITSDRKTQTFERTSSKIHFELPFSVNYVAKSYPTVPFTHPDFAKLRVLSRLMTNKFLHREIREKGGAYGGGAQSGSPGVFSFYSYRDPNSTETVERFDEACHWAVSGDFTQQDVDEAILAVFQKVDAPVAPGDRGLRHFLHRITDELKEDHRQRLMSVTVNDIGDVTQRYLLNTDLPNAITLLGPENETLKSDKNWTVKQE